MRGRWWGVGAMAAVVGLSGLVALCSRPEPLAAPTPRALAERKLAAAAASAVRAASPFGMAPAGSDSGGEETVFQQQVDLFQAASRQRPSGTDLRALALPLDAGLEAALARGDISAADAQALKAELLQTLEPDPVQRARRLAQWARAHPVTP